MDRLGGGGTAVMWRAISDDGEAWAVKQARPAAAGDAAVQAALRAEARLLGRLSHPAIPRLRATGETNEAGFHFAMNLLPGADLRETLRTDGGGGAPGGAAAVGRLLAGAASALEHLHAAGYVHGDVKPANIMRGPDGRSSLIDYAAAAPARDDALDPRPGVPEGAAWGTVAYAAPERRAGLPDDPRDDVYSLACVAYALLTGAPPGMPDPPRPAAIGRRAWVVLAACLGPARADRPYEATALTAAMRPRGVLARLAAS